MGKSTLKIEFANSRGDRLAGLLDMPDGTPRAYGVFGPCFTCVKESHGAFRIGRALADLGIACLRFDTTGIGASTGDLAHTNFSTRIDDIISAAQALSGFGHPASFIAGHSMSGTAALSAAKHLPGIGLIATIGSPQDPAATMDKFESSGLLRDLGDTVAVTVIGQEYIFDKSFVADMRGQTVAADTAAYDRDLLVFHAPNDNIVPFSHAGEIARRAVNARSCALVALSDAATHLFEKGAEDAAFIASKISEKITG